MVTHLLGNLLVNDAQGIRFEIIVITATLECPVCSANAEKIFYYKGEKIMKIKAAVCYEPGSDLVIDEIDLAEPKSGEVLVKIVATGICGTDVAMRENAWGFGKYPIVLGHEGAGIIEQIGPGVKGFEVGDHVVLSYPSCGTCDPCATGHSNHCDANISLSYDGLLSDGTSRFSKNGEPINCFFGQSSFATHTVVSIRNAVKIDKAWDLKTVGPLGCGYMTGAGTVLNLFNPGPGSSIAVCGTGGVGLAAIMAAKACNCGTIIAVDVHKSRLDMALEMGATDVINAKEVENITGEIQKITGGSGVNFMVETTGKTVVANQAIDALAPGGEGGMIAPDYTAWTVENMFFKFFKKTIHPIVMGEAAPQITIPKMLKLSQMDLFPFERLLKFYKFEDINQAIADSKSGAVIKPVLVMPE